PRRRGLRPLIGEAIGSISGEQPFESAAVSSATYLVAAKAKSDSINTGHGTMRNSKRTWLRPLRCELDVTPLMRVWILRMLVPLGAHRKFVQSNGFADDDLAEVLGLGKWIDSSDGEFKSEPVRSELRRLHRAAEHGKAAGGIPPLLNANVAGLGNMVGLD